MKRQNPTYDFRIVNETGIETLLRDKFPPIFYETYQSIHPDLQASKGDFWRYCVLFLYGGIYIDLDAQILRPLEEWVDVDNDADASVILAFEKVRWNYHCPKTVLPKCHCHAIWEKLGLEAFPDVLRAPDGVQYSIAQWAMVFPKPYHPILKEIILYMMVLLHHRWDEQDKGLHLTFEMQSKILCTTGPGMYTVAIARAFEKYNATYLKTKFADGQYKGLIQHPVGIVKKSFQIQQMQHYTEMSRSHPLLVGNGTVTKIDEGDYFQQASLPGLRKD